MADDRTPGKRHFLLQGAGSAERYRYKGRGGSGLEPPPERPRASHGAALRRQLEEVETIAAEARSAQKEAGLQDGFGIQVEFASFPDIDLAFASLARERSGIELQNVQHHKGRTIATVFVPDGKLNHFEGVIRDYLAEKKDRKGKARDNRPLVDAIESIRSATLESLWTDAPEQLPASEDEPFWWEVWLPVRSDRRVTLDVFRRLAERRGFRVLPGHVEFPERTVLVAFGSPRQMKESILVLNSIAELRRVKETADFFGSLPVFEQREWLEDLLSRTSFPADSDEVPRVCILDTGLNAGHPLLRTAVVEDDLHSIEPGWGVDDRHGHGTEMAGVALAGNLVEPLESRDLVGIRHRLESVKVLRHEGDNTGTPRHHGYLTVEAVARPEISAPSRPRIFCMAITAEDGRDRGRPSAWSAAIDRITSDAEGVGGNPRLFLVSAGNIRDSKAWRTYPSSNETDSVRDPAQAWNALAIGAYTRFDRITEPDATAYRVIAQAGGLSPFSTTSLPWESEWPLKPDVVFEGGNAALDGSFASTFASLSLLTTSHEISQRLFASTNATSAATALGARMAAEVMAAYPELWSETVRGLIVHSAQWTDVMTQMFLPKGKRKMADYARLVRRCGFGVPDLDRALWSAANSLTLIAQDSIQPFQREPGKDPGLRELKLHSLPWPREELLALGASEVEMRVTLSYFIEPNPSSRGMGSRYCYESHGLRFDMRRRNESTKAFHARINAAATDSESGTIIRERDQGWLLGTDQRHRGSLHSDVWRGSAADLATRDVVAVYPVSGWWKTRVRHARYDTPARYALLVSIHAPDVDVDLYGAIEQQIGVAVEVET